jgi:hypothetical protein
MRDAAVHFLYDKEIRKRREYIEFADDIYKRGIVGFPRHGSLRIDYGLFLYKYKQVGV